MAKELETMRETRIKQKNIRISLKNREESNKKLRAQITPIWTDRERDAEVQGLSKELVKGREKVRNYQKQLREFKETIKETNRAYDLYKGE